MDEYEAEDDGTERRSPVEARLDDRVPMLAAEIVTGNDRPAECTVYPRDATETERMTRWITAEEGSFIALEEMR
jgi:hypothetical protein